MGTNTTSHGTKTTNKKPAIKRTSELTKIEQYKQINKITIKQHSNKPTSN